MHMCTHNTGGTLWHIKAYAGGSQGTESPLLLKLYLIQITNRLACLQTIFLKPKQNM